VTALPFFIRNVLLSGWLVYPFTRIDLFDVKWKIPKGMADYDAREIQVWGRGYSDVSRYEIPVEEWLPDWFRSLAGSDKLLVLLPFLFMAHDDSGLGIGRAIKSRSLFFGVAPCDHACDFCLCKSVKRAGYVLRPPFGSDVLLDGLARYAMPFGKL
jgi:hypothetical protein